MAGEDRQQFARDSHLRYERYLTTAKALEKDGKRAEAKKYRGLSERCRRQRDQYDDAGEFASFAKT